MLPRGDEKRALVVANEGDLAEAMQHVDDARVEHHHMQAEHHVPQLHRHGIIARGRQSA